MDAHNHSENIYGKKAPNAGSWYRPHLEKSLELIDKAAPERSASIIDVGGGESTLVDDLVARGYKDITVLDISQIAIDVTKKRLGPASKNIHWLAGDFIDHSAQRENIRACFNLPAARLFRRHVRNSSNCGAWARQTERQTLPQPSLLPLLSVTL